jgi:hypothetical protein
MRTSLLRPGWTLTGSSPTTWRDVIARVGRLLLWLAVVFVLMRGLAGMAEARRPVLDRRGADGAQTATGAWPDERRGRSRSSSPPRTSRMRRVRTRVSTHAGLRRSRLANSPGRWPRRSIVARRR